MHKNKPDKSDTKAPYELSLDAINFFLADVRGALGPYLNVFLVTQQHWTQTNVGLVNMIGGLLGLAAQTPIGAAIDSIRKKREIVVVALFVLAGCSTLIYFQPAFWLVALSTSLMSIVGDVFGPAVAAITLGVCTREALAKRLGRNSALDHAGNVAIALVAGGVGHTFGQKAVFLLVPVFAVLAAISVMSVPAEAIDYDRARGLESEGQNKTTGSCRVLFKKKPLIIFSFCVMLFHFANAPLLPLVGQKLAIMQPKLATVLMSACIIAAQLVMLPIAVAVGNNADKGRKPIFLIGFAILPIRSLLYMMSDSPAWLVGVQLLDGVGAGIFGVLTPLAIADIMKDTPHFNLAQGFVATIQGLGACLSGLVAGWLVDHLGYNAAFSTSAIAAIFALGAYSIFMPETKTRTIGQQ